MSTQQKIMDIFNFFDCPLETQFVMKHLKVNDCKLEDSEIKYALSPLLSAHILIFNKEGLLEEV